MRERIKHDIVFETRKSIRNNISISRYMIDAELRFGNDDTVDGSEQDWIIFRGRFKRVKDVDSVCIVSEYCDAFRRGIRGLQSEYEG